MNITTILPIQAVSRYYFLKDHPSVDGQVLGSVRTTVDFSNTALGYDPDFHRGKLYPFGIRRGGMPGRSSSSSTPDDDYKFTGHQRDAELDLDYMLARNYDPLIGRFMQVDPLAIDYPSITPYGYVLNNPMGLVDSDGKQPRPPYSFGFDFKTTFQSLLSNYDPTFLGRYARAESYGQLEMEVAVDALDAGIATTDAIAFGADNIETVALASSLLPIAAGAGLVNTIADATSVGLEFQKANLTNSSFSKAESKLDLLLVSQISGFMGKRIIKNSFNHFDQSTRYDKPIPLFHENHRNQIIELGRKTLSKSSILLVKDDIIENRD
jgi:RHS repeat-associated protein